MKIAIDSVLPSDSPRLDGENVEHVKVLAESAESLPPIIVHRATMRVIDGMHRLRAARMRGVDQIDVRFFNGCAEDAFVLAVETNVVHGLPLSAADRGAAVERILQTHPQWSDRAIASVTGLSAKTVGVIRRRAAVDVPQLRVRVGRDGRVRPLDCSDGRRLASELMASNPNASLRQIGKAANISIGTARDVRQRMRRGEDPVPPRQRGGSEGGDQPRPAVREAVRNRGEILHRLRNDPSLRFTEAGRALLRLLDVYSVDADKWLHLSDSVPPHCVGVIAEVAIECATVWQEFAEQLNLRRCDTA
ncbi:ParB/RepB/Spo0J family partition protein [Kutzneria sp. NPDC052558]|uniref:ParB/RepB/Spo0J family partition protein n=1 Tax=Kutzneria sp. NPDC052558 TaxID=3364121 RepID=UPI0037C84432